jgi:hypothetical protein
MECSRGRANRPCFITACRIHYVAIHAIYIRHGAVPVPYSGIFDSAVSPLRRPRAKNRTWARTTHYLSQPTP